MPEYKSGKTTNNFGNNNRLSYYRHFVYFNDRCLVPRYDKEYSVLLQTSGAINMIESERLRITGVKTRTVYCKGNSCTRSSHCHNADIQIAAAGQSVCGCRSKQLCRYTCCAICGSRLSLAVSQHTTALE